MKQNGLRAFHRNDFTAAIKEWSRLDLKTDPAAGRVLAEAHFRRATTGKELEPRLADLTAAVELAPNEGRYWYHLGLAQHRAGRLDEACAAYAHAADAGFSRRPLGFARSLAELERNPALDRASLDALSGDAAALWPIAALLRGEPQAVLKPEAAHWLERLRGLARGDVMAALWRGLALLSAGQVELAAGALAGQPSQTLPAEANAVRLFYRGLALAAMGDPPAALAEWSQVAAPYTSSRLRAAIAGLHRAQVEAALSAGRWAEVVQITEAAFKPAGPSVEQPELLAATLVARNRLAAEAAAREAWAEAIAHWEAMAALLDLAPALGSRGPLLHNLAIAHEAREEWALAAGAWAELMNTLPRRQTKARASAGPPADRFATLPVAEKRAWLRRRILDCYKKGGQPDQAITYYRAAVKASPDDLDLRLELANALLANDQEIAGRNELRRILERDPKHQETLVKLAEVHRDRGEIHEAEHLLREAHQDDPKSEPVRRGLTDILRDRGHGLFNAGQIDRARQVYASALELTPDDVDLLASIGFAELRQDDEPAARTHFEAALARGTAEAYHEVLWRWASHGSLPEVRALLARAEAIGVATPHFYVNAAISCLRAAPLPEPELPDLFSLAPKKKAPKQPSSNPWDELSTELLNKAVSGGERTDLLKHIVSDLVFLRPEMALPYATRLTTLAPGDPMAWMLLGLAQACAERKREAKESLRKSATLARPRGDPELIHRIEELRRAVDDPLFSFMIRSLPFLGDLGEDFLP